MAKAKGAKLSKLMRRKRESEVAHRSFLLWAMQMPKKRNVRLTARASNRSEATLRDFKKRWEWAERATGITSDVEAQTFYRKLYIHKVGTKEIEVVEKNIATPISKIGTLPRSVAQIVDKTIKHQRKELKKKDPEEEMRRKHVGLIDAAIGYIAAGIRDGDVKANIRDIPLLLQMRNMILKVEEANKTPQIVLESLRVRQAKDMGTDIIEAMIEDGEELLMILKSVRIAKRDNEMFETESNKTKA